MTNRYQDANRRRDRLKDELNRLERDKKREKDPQKIKELEEKIEEVGEQLTNIEARIHELSRNRKGNKDTNVNNQQGRSTQGNGSQGNNTQGNNSQDNNNQVDNADEESVLEEKSKKLEQEIQELSTRKANEPELFQWRVLDREHSEKMEEKEAIDKKLEDIRRGKNTKENSSQGNSTQGGNGQGSNTQGNNGQSSNTQGNSTQGNNTQGNNSQDNNNQVKNADEESVLKEKSEKLRQEIRELATRIIGEQNPSERSRLREEHANKRSERNAIVKRLNDIRNGNTQGNNGQSSNSQGNNGQGNNTQRNSTQGNNAQGNNSQDNNNQANNADEESKLEERSKKLEQEIQELATRMDDEPDSLVWSSLMGDYVKKTREKEAIDDKLDDIRRGKRRDFRNDIQGNNGQSSNTQGSNTQGNNGQSSNTQGNNTQGNNGQSSNTQRSNTQGNNTQGNNGQSSNTQGSNGQGSNTQGNNSQSSNTQGSNGQGNNTQGNNGQSSNTQGNNGQSSNTQGNNGQGNNGQGSNTQGNNGQAKVPEFKFRKKPEDYINKDDYEEYVSDMLDKYYGNNKKEKKYNELMKKVESAKVDIGHGLKRIDENKITEDDLKFLQLDEYNKKVDRLLKWKKGDTSVYANDEEREKDEKYIESNNYAYNRVLATKNSLMTLGKYGEKVNYLTLKNTTPIKAVGRALINGALFIRNIGAVVYRGIGKPVSKLYGKFAKQRSGIYSNKPMHRYEARKDYFIKKENDRLASKGEQARPIRTLFKARMNAIIKYKEGNAAVLESGYSEIKKTILNKAKAEYFSEKLDDLNDYIQRRELEINWYKNKNQLTQDESDVYSEVSRTKKNAEDMRNAILNNPNLADIVKGKTIDKNSIDTVVPQTDAVSLNQHDRANKANVTRIITGIKMLGGAAIKFTSPKLEDWMLQHAKIKITEKDPSVIDSALSGNVKLTKRVDDYADVTKISSEQDLLETFSIKNLMKLSKDDTASYAYGNYGNIAHKSGLDYFRGAAQKIDGKLVSISDGNGYDYSRITADIIPPELLKDGVISDDATVFDIVAALQRQAGRDVTARDLIDKVINCGSKDEQAQLIQEMTDGLDFCESISPVGMGNGWNSSREEILSALEQVGTVTTKVRTGSHIEEVVNPEIVAGVINRGNIAERIIDNPRIIKALGIADKIKEGMDVLDAISMTFENMRDTKSKIVDNKNPRDYSPKPKAGFKGKSKRKDKKVDMDKIVEDTAKEIEDMER